MDRERPLRYAPFWIPAAAALLRWLALPGWDWAPLAIPAVALRIYWWEGGGGRIGDYLGGVLFWLVTFSFLTHTHVAFPIGPALVLGLWWAIEGLLYGRIRRFLPVAVAGPLALAAVEVMRGQFPMGGVPWASWSMGFANVPFALDLARSVGESGLTLLVLLTGGCVYALFKRSSWHELVIAPGAIAAVAFLAIAAGPPPPPLDSIDALAVQPNISVIDKSEDGLQAEYTLFGRNRDVAREFVKRGDEPELMIWAETMLRTPTLQEDGRGELRIRRRNEEEAYVLPAEQALESQRRVARDATQLVQEGGWWITGAHFYEPVDPSEVSGVVSPRSSRALAFDHSGRLVSNRAKNELVPFGERLPMDGGFPYAQTFELWIHDQFGLLPNFRVDQTSPPLRLPRSDGAPITLGVAVCWENVFEHVFRKQAEEEAVAFCILSNEAWYGTGEEMDQMVAATRFRAAETGRAILRSTNTGLTVLVDAEGAILKELPRAVQACLRADLPLSHPNYRTPYMVGGWVLLPGAAVLGLLLAAWPRRKRELGSS